MSTQQDRMRIDQSHPAELSAEELAVRAKSGHEPSAMAAYSQLVDRYHARLYSFLLRRLPAADAEDLTQEAFIRAWQRIETYNPRYRFSTWLFTIAQRLAISHGRKSGSGTLRLEHGFRATGVAGDAGWAEAGHPGDGPDRHEQRVRIWSLVDKILPEEQRTAVWLRYAEGMNIADIANILGRTQVGVRVMLFRARAVLAQRLEQTDDGVSERDEQGGGREPSGRREAEIEAAPGPHTVRSMSNPRAQWSGGAA